MLKRLESALVILSNVLMENTFLRQLSWKTCCLADAWTILIKIQVFHTEERLRRTIHLAVDVSDGGEIVRGSKHLTF